MISLALTKVMSGIGPFFLLLGLLIFVHELGHYLVAVYYGVRVETFSLGFGKKIFSHKRGDTTYCVSLIPLGGYVKMYGDDPTVEIPLEERQYSFLHKPVWPRIAIVLAGPVMNLLFAILVFAVIGALGEEVPSAQLGDVGADSAAYAAGFRSGDKIKSVNGEVVSQWTEVKEMVEANAGRTLTFDVSGEHIWPLAIEDRKPVQATPELGKNSFLFSTQREVGRVDGLSPESAAAIIGVESAQAPAYAQGLRNFDVIEKIDGHEIHYWREIEPRFLQALSENKTSVDLEVRSYDQESKDSQTRNVSFQLPTTKPQQELLSQLGIAKADLFLMSVRPKSPAANAGLQKGDYVTTINGEAVSNWQTVLDYVKNFKPEAKQITFGVLRNGEQKKITVTPELTDLPTEQGAMESRYAIGVVPAILSTMNTPYMLKTTNPIKMLSYGVTQAWVWSKLIAISFVRLVQNEVSARNIGGVITIGRVASKSFEAGTVAFLKMMAIISINLFLLNLLPVPVLDGGHLMFFTIEALKGAPISFKKLEMAQQFGLVLLLSLMLFALFNDITHLISSW